MENTTLSPGVFVKKLHLDVELDLAHAGYRAIVTAFWYVVMVVVEIFFS